MDCDDRLFLADKFVDTDNNDDDDDDDHNDDDDDDNYEEIERDLEDKLYAAVFHSNDLSSSMSKDIPAYSRVTSLTDGITLWKSSSHDSDNSAKTKKTSCTTSYEPTNSGEKRNTSSGDSCEIGSDKCVQTRNRCESISSKKNSELSSRDESRVGTLTVDHIKFMNLNPTIQSDKAKPYTDFDDNELVTNKHRRGISAADLYGSDETISVFGDKNTTDKEKKSLQSKVAKKSKASPKKTPYCNESGAKGSSTKLWKQSDSVDKADTWATIQFPDVAANALPKDAVESSNVKAEDEVEKTESAETQPQYNLSCTAEEDSHRPASIPPEEEVGNDAKMEHEASCSSSRDCSSNAPSTSIAGKDKPITDGHLDVAQNVGNEWCSVITIDDSEDSICEVPVPPKPQPPTIHLDDSNSSTSSSSDSSSNKMSRKKQKKYHKNAVSKSITSNQSAGCTESTEARKEVSIAQKETEKNRNSCYSDWSSSDSDDSMTENEEEHWGIIAGSQMNKDQPAHIFSDDTRMSPIVEESTIQQGSSSHPILAHRDENNTDISDEQERQDGNYLDELLSRYLETSKKIGTAVSTSVNSATPEKESGGVRELSSLRGQTLSTPNEKYKNSEIRQDLISDDLLIINVAEHEMTQILSSPVASRESQTSAGTPESRKRPIMDSGKKFKHQNSPKKARNSDEPVESTSSSTKSPKENKENRKKQRNCAGDYFFIPMNPEMTDYYKSDASKNFNIDDIRKQMPKDPRYWAISDEDLLNYRQRGSRYWTRMKCRNCNGSDHNTSECTSKRKLPCCHMCGISGHREPRCPHKMCLGCGKKQLTYMQICNECKKAWCNGCRSYGHLEDKCPDHWRRYHLTTSMRNVITNLSATDVMKPSHQLSCCNCAKRGHDSATCKNYRWSRHFPTPSYVTNYSIGPAYADHVIFEDTSSNFSTENPTEPVQEPADIEVRVRNTDLPRSQKKRKEDKVPQGNLRTDIVDERIDESRKQSKDQSKSNVEKSHKSTELLLMNSKSTHEVETLLRLESELLNGSFIHASDLSESVESLSTDQCKNLVESDLSRQFLHNLVTQFPVKLVVERFRREKVVMTITGMEKLRGALKHIIMDWLSWPVDERSRFVNLNLPKTKKALIDLLSCKLNELEQDLGDPIEIFRNVQSLKDRLQSMQRQLPTGRTVISSKRVNVVSELAKSQCKLNMILLGQSKTRRHEKSCKYLRQALCNMQRITSTNYVSAHNSDSMQQIDNQNHVEPSVYLNIVHHYNKIFAAYTPPNILDLLNQYKQKQMNDQAKVKKRKPKNKRKKSRNKTKVPDYRSYIISLNRVNQNHDINSTTSAGSNVSFTASDQILPKGINSSREGTCTTVNRNVSRNIEAQLQASSMDVSNPNRDLERNLPKPLPMLTNHWNNVEQNYYNLKYNFDNISAEKKQGRSTRFQENVQHADSVNNDVCSLQNRIENNFRRKSKRIYQNDTLQGSLSSGATANGFSDIPKVGYQGNLSEKNRSQESYILRKNSIQDNFICDRQPETSEDGLINNTHDFPNIAYNRRGRPDAHATSSPAIYNHALHAAINESPGIAVETEKHRVNKKDRKEKPSPDGSLPLYLQKRAAKKVEKYVNSEHPCIAQKARELQHKLGQKSLTLHCTLDFERLIKRQLEKTDHLLSKRY
ncbi:uncharacterized protein LOC124181009 isoform X2 [Neodiprion fabricii]|uniref:uncharacterized protein LOC124181009 isoform X2 n=1 Tax=Neodiprion fabricii TaxID=2872261 RepID=UPI001ED92E2C|nr:uncharacterized protein LOC124181009 isoform X2 [Neodiprion fabricii]